MKPGYETAVETHDARVYPPYQTPPLSGDDIEPVIESNAPQLNASKNFTQVWGLHPGIALLTVCLDTMLFGGQIGTLEAIYPLVIASAFGLGIVTFMAQKKWYGDDNESALIKAIIVAGLTAIPTSLPGFLCVPAGVVGLFRKADR